MTLLVLGLLLFLGTHSIRIFADGWRTAQIARLGAGPWKGLYALASLAGFVLIVYGFGLARAAPVVLWTPPVWTRHVTALLMMIAFILLTAAYVRGNHLNAAIGHPMLAATKIWALAHLLANGNVAHVVLFGAFLAWSIVAFASSRRRDRAAGTKYPAPGAGRDLLTVVIGLVAWGLFAHYGHLWLIGVKPL